MPKLDVSVSSLQVFAIAGKYQSFSHAAEELFLTTSAVSQSIKRVEEQVGVKLFDRKGNSVALTDDGSMLLRDVEAAFSQIKFAIEKLRARSLRSISISSPPGLASLLNPVIKKITSLDYWDFRLVCDENPDYDSYRGFDISLIYGDKAQDFEDLESLGPDVFLPVCSPNLASSFKSFNELGDIPLLLNESSPVTWDDWMEMNDFELSRLKYLRFNRAVHLISAAIDGQGIALESLRVLSQHIWEGRLVILTPHAFKPIVKNIAHMYVRHHLASEQVSEVSQIIRRQCSTSSNGILQWVLDGGIGDPIDT